jgi:translocation and assembly module TamB
MMVAAIGGYWCLESAWFQNFALRKIEAAADSATGGKTTVGRLDFSLSALTANLYDITLRGQEGGDQPPLVHADKLVVRFKIQSLFDAKVSLRELLIDHPVVHLQVSREGSSNLPTPPPVKSGSRTSVFDLAVGHARLTNGEVNYNDQKTPLDADLNDLTTDIHFTDLPRQYQGSLFYRDGRVSYDRRAALPHDLDLRFQATPEKLTLNSAVLRVGSSEISLQAEVAHYSNPVADGSYRIRIHTQDFHSFSPSLRPEGDLSLTGKLHYQAIANQSWLRNVSLDGQIRSQALRSAASGRRVQLARLEGEYRLAGGNLKISDLSLDWLGGRLLATVEMNHLDATPESRVSASFENISLRAFEALSGVEAVPGAALSGALGGTADATWKGGMDQLRLRSDLTVRARAESTANPSATEVPVNGAIHVAYDGASGTIQLRDTALHLPSANLTAQGTISDHSALELQVVSDDLHQLAVLASSFLPGRNSPPAVSGKATLSAVVQGSVKRPNVNARLNAQNLEVEGSQWRSAQLTLNANPSQLIIQNGSLVSARKGHASFNASVKLHDWSYQPSDPVQARVAAQQMSITDLLEMANQHYPVSGDLTGNLAFSGSQLDPAGSGKLEIGNAKVYGEPLDRLVTNFHAENGSITTNLTATAKAGAVNGDLTYTPKTRAYKVRVAAPGIVLEHLRMLERKNVPVAGTVSASVNGEGTLDDPQLVASVELPELQVRGKTIYEMKVDAQVAQHKLDWNLDSKVSEVPVHGHGKVALAGEYDTDASLDTGTVPLPALLAAFAESVPDELQGQAELHATLKGPLQDKSRLEAHLSIPVLKASYHELQVGIPRPIRADYANSVVTLQPADIEGTGTKLHFEGQVPVAGRIPPTLTAQGSVDLHILRILAPNVSSSGTLALDVHSATSGGQPGFEGQVHLTNVAMTTAEAPIGIEKLNGTLNITNDTVHLSEMKGQMGGGQVTFGGSIAYRPSLQFNLAVQSQSVRLLYPEGLRSVLDANLALTGTTAASTVNGRVIIDSLSFTPDFDLPSFSDQFSAGGSVPQPGFADTVHLQIAVQSRENLQATSSQISIEGQAALHVGGTAANPVITGRATLTSGELFYRTVRYELERGVITFDDPNQTRPVLNVSVNTTIEQYKLTLTMRGPLDNLTTSYTSDPPLATADIINLVARGRTTQESAASSQSTDSIIASEAAGQLTSSLQRLAGISSLRIDPTLGGNNQNPSAQVAFQQRITKNFLFSFSTDVSQPGQEIIQGEYRINRRWSVSAARDQSGGLSVDGRYHSRF